MADPIKPRDIKEVEAAVQWALAQAKTLEVVGQGSKRALGRPAQTDATLDLSALAGVTLYEPEELVLSAKAGTPLAEIEQLTASHGQELAFEPMDYGPLLGVAPGGGTIGGMVAASIIGIFFIPVLYVIFQWLRETIKGWGGGPTSKESAPAQPSSAAH